MVSQSVLLITIEAIVTKAPIATISTGKGGTSSSSSICASSMTRKAGISGRPGFQRSATAPPATPPIDAPAPMMPQAAAPPISRMATSGPSTWNAPSEMFEIEKVRMQATTQERDTTSCQPSASSATKARRRAGSTAGMRIATRKAALTRKLAPSMAKAQPAPMVATIRPDSSGPKMWVALCEMLISALASCSRFAPTICGIRPIEAGMKKAAALPITTRKGHQLPDLGIAGDQQRGHHRLGPGTHQVAGDHHSLPRQAIGPDAAGQREQDARQREGGEDEAQVRGRAGQLQDGEGERHAHQRIAQV